MDRSRWKIDTETLSAINGNISRAPKSRKTTSPIYINKQGHPSKNEETNSRNSKGQPFKKILKDNINKDASPPSDLPNIKTHQVILSII